MAEAAPVVINQYSVMALLRQVGVLVGIAAAVALGVAVVLWSQEPGYRLLYGNLSSRDLAEIQQTLQQSDIPFKVDQESGALLVASSKMDEARIKLAAAGLPKSNSLGFELLQQEQEFGTSQFIEQARYQHALEIELGRSIARLSNVRSARVHIALPRQTAFVRKQRPPSASVLVDLYPGRSLEPGEIDAIAHLVAASVPNLNKSNVTVVDQKGRLLSSRESDPLAREADRRFEYVKKLESSYVARIENILSPVVGLDGVKAQVTVDVDFTQSEHASETYNPDLPALRSEQTSEESGAGGAPSGVPGALSNQPPPAGVAPEQATGEGGGTGQGGAGGGGTLRKRQVRNFELDRTITHVRRPVGDLRRLSVAVVVENHKEKADDGTVVYRERTPEELERLTLLVKEAVGFDAARGDTVNVIGADFITLPPPEPIPEEPIWKQAWVIDLAKQVGGGLIALIIALVVIRPVIRSLLSKPAPVALAGAAAGAEGQAALPGAEPGQPALPGTAGQGEEAGGGAPQQELSPAEAARRLVASPEYEQNLTQVREFVKEEPKLAAQVVKHWTGAE